MEKKNLFEKWDKEIDTENLQKDVAEAAENGGQATFKEVPEGEYEVEVNQMELKASKNGDPMISIWFKIINGEYKNSILFMNQVVTQGFQIHIVNELLRSLVAEMEKPIDIDFKNYKQYSELLMDVFEAITGNFEYALSYKENSKGFKTFKVEEVFVLED